jgi:hypothetical protein
MKSIFFYEIKHQPNLKNFFEIEITIQKLDKKNYQPQVSIGTTLKDEIKKKKQLMNEGTKRKRTRVDTILKKKQKGLPFVFVSIFIPSFLISCK